MAPRKQRRRRRCECGAATATRNSGVLSLMEVAVRERVQSDAGAVCPVTRAGKAPLALNFEFYVRSLDSLRSTASDMQQPITALAAGLVQIILNERQ
jgi:hypothetical protein